MVLKLDHYLESRAEYDEVAGKLHRAEGALDVLKLLKEKHEVPIPDFKFAELNAEVDVCKKRVELRVVEDFNSSKLLLELPGEIGAVDVEKMDFRVALQMDFESALQSAGGDYVETGERGEASARAVEEEAKESQNAGIDDSVGGRTEERGGKIETSM